MTIVTVIFWIVAALWLAVALCIFYMIIDITRMRREREELEARIKAMPPPIPIVPYRVHGMTPEARRELQLIMEAQQAIMENGFLYGSQALLAVIRCDICGATTADQKTERCRNACGQIHGGKTTAVQVLDASSWTGRAPN